MQVIKPGQTFAKGDRTIRVTDVEKVEGIGTVVKGDVEGPNGTGRYEGRVGDFFRAWVNQ